MGVTLYMHTHTHTHTHSPLQRMARLRPRASAVLEFMFSTTLCFTFFSTETKAREKSKAVDSEFLSARTHINREYWRMHHESLGSDKHKVLLSILSIAGKQET